MDQTKVTTEMINNDERVERIDKNSSLNDVEEIILKSNCEVILIKCNDGDMTTVDDTESNTTVHGFNLSANTTCIEKELESSPETDTNINNKQMMSCEGSDSGVEVIENSAERCTLQRTLSTNSANFQEFDSMTPARSCDSSIISCCSNYEEAYNLLARRNSTLLEDYKLRNSDGTSEGGSESSSVVSTKNSTSKRNPASNVKKKVALNDNKCKTPPISSNRRTKLTNSQKTLLANVNNSNSRAKSTDRLPPKTPNNNNNNNANNNIKSIGSSNNAKTPSKTRTVPDNLPLMSSNKKDNVKKTAARGNSINKTPIATPSDDGRWPSVNSKPAPLLAKNLRSDQKRILTNNNIEVKSNALEKYATLPRRRKERSAESFKELKKSSRESSVGRTASFRKQTTKETPQKTLPPYPRKKTTPKIKIYHETSIQTALTLDDIEKAFNGVTVQPLQPQDVEKFDKEIQADRKHEEFDKLQEQHNKLNELYDKLKIEYDEQKKLFLEADDKLKCEIIEKNGLKEELRQNSDRVLAILGNDDAISKDDDKLASDSLMVLEDRFQTVSHVVIKQEDEISKLNECCRSLQRDLEKSLAAQKILLQQQQELEAETIELQEFMQAEKGTLSEAIKELELENQRCKLLLSQNDKDFETRQDEYKHVVRISEQRRQENVSLQAKLGVLEGKCRELLVHQGSTVSGAAVALSALISRLDGLVEELVTSYNISDQELDDVIFHNEAYSHSGSSTDATPEKSKKFFVDKTPSPKGRGSTFVAAVINAIRNAAAQTPFSNRDINKDNLCTDNSDSIEMLDSETEPCLMMEHVLEDVIVPDGHTHNMISSCHSMINSRLSHSESLNNLTQSYYNNRQLTEQNISLTESLNASFTSDVSHTSEYGNSISVVDQVIEVDNLITRLLKVIRIIQLENEDCMNEIQEERDAFSQQVDKQKDTNKVVVKQLKDWEILGASLKSEVKELIHKLTKKNDEINDIKCELNQQRHEVEKLNQDVCDLSTALSKTELELRTKDEEVLTILKKYEETGEYPVDKDELAKLTTFASQVTHLKETIVQREKQLTELTQEYIVSKEVLFERWNETVREAKKLYEAIDGALEILQGMQVVVKQCPPLAKLQRDLEETNFRSASGLPLVEQPPDCNANAALLQAIANLGVTAPINTTA